jgi:hypothetical protein
MTPKEIAVRRGNGVLSMELPRGRFLSVVRNTIVSFLFEDLSDTLFTGYCVITGDQGHAVIVLEKGSIVLAEYNDYKGNSALEGLRSSLNMPVNAQLNELSDLQLKLALEFNSGCRVRCGIKEDRPECPEVAEPPGSDFRSEPECNQGLFLSPQQTVSEPEISEDGISEKTQNAEEEKEDSDLPTRTSNITETLTKNQGMECEEEEPPDWRRALHMPIIPADNASSRFSPEKDLAGKACEKPGLIFEPLKGDSPLFEGAPILKEKQVRSSADTAEKWRFMSVNKEENTSV